MQQHITITREPLAASAPSFPCGSDSGAWLDFYGVVRGHEGERAIEALDYEAYEPMARREIEHIMNDLAVKYRVQEVWLVHRIGRVPAGEPSLHVRVRSPHRAEALSFTGDLIDALKQSVPIWKAA